MSDQLCALRDFFKARQDIAVVLLIDDAITEYMFPEDQGTETLDLVAEFMDTIGPSFRAFLVQKENQQ